MSPIIFLIVGLLLVWLVFTGRANNVWIALTNNSPLSWSDGSASGGGARSFQ